MYVRYIPHIQTYIQTDNMIKLVKMFIIASKIYLTICVKWVGVYFDVNRSTFDEDMRVVAEFMSNYSTTDGLKKNFLYFLRLPEA